MAACGAKYGMMTCHFYWLGAVAAMVFVGVFMMPFYYGSKARSVPEYLKLRFDEKTRAFNAISFAVMTIFSSGISMYALADAVSDAVELGFQPEHLRSRRRGAGLYLPRRIDFGHLQRSAAILPDRDRLPAAGDSRAVGYRRLGRPEGEIGGSRRTPSPETFSGQCLDERLGQYGLLGEQSDARRLDRHDVRPGLRAGVRLLVYRLLGGPAGDGRRIDVGRPADADLGHDSENHDSGHRDHPRHDRAGGQAARRRLSRHLPNESAQGRRCRQGENRCRPTRA